MHRNRRAAIELSHAILAASALGVAAMAAHFFLVGPPKPSHEGGRWGSELASPLRGELREGMTAPEVVAAVGSPLDVVPVKISFGCESARRDYERRFGDQRPFVYAYASTGGELPDTYLFFEGGRLTRVQAP
ncbi:MAG: hypothetical protein SF028_07755 [Candidatus Sumerlaeia bacterium]|nr:hypothetical protein [Candidatus Sumerlaeia bacterium]